MMDLIEQDPESQCMEPIQALYNLQTLGENYEQIRLHFGVPDTGKVNHWWIRRAI